jgi:3-deoxy-D-manno-octulosonic-acid transferase
VLFAAWLELRRSVPDARLIIAPHEPTPKHLGPIRRWAHASALPLALLGDDTAGHADVILVDRVGVLGDLYALADAAYVGGGFHAAGLHSVLEPAAFGVPVVFGPRHQNSRDASLLIECDGGESVADAPTLTRALRIVLTEPDTRRGASDAARALIGAGLGAAEKSVDLIERLLAPRAGAR